MAAYTSGFTVLYNGVATDLTARYVSKEDLIDRYPSLASYAGGKIFPGLWGWARSTNGVLGNGTTGLNYSSPVQIGALTNWKQVSSDLQALAIRTDGTLWAWGDGAGGRLGNGSIASYSSPVQIGALTDWNQASAGGASFGIRTNGTLWSWGENTFGILGTSISTSLKYSSPIQVGALTNWKKVKVAKDTTQTSVIALTTAGTIFSWGDNSAGQLGLNDRTDRSSPVQIGSLTAWADIDVSLATVYAIKTDGTLWAWGRNETGQYGNGNIINYSSPVQIGALTNWKQVSAGQFGAAAVKTDGTLWTWGVGGGASGGPLGNGQTAADYSSPIQVGALTDWKQVSYHSDQQSVLCVKTDGTLWAWGENSFGQLGLNDRTGRSSPVQVGASTTGWKSISAGAEAVFAILDGYQ